MNKKNKTYPWLQKEIDYINDHSKNLPDRRKKFMKQLKTQGWTDADTWSLDHCLAKWLLPRLKRFNELNNGHPHGLTMKKWQSTIQKMIDAFDFISSDAYYITYDKKTWEKVDEGLDLFREYFHHLWW